MRRLVLPTVLATFVLAACVGPKWRTVDGDPVSGEMLKDCSQFTYKLRETDLSDTDEMKRVAEISRASCPREDWIKVAPLACMSIKYGCDDVVITEFDDE